MNTFSSRFVFDWSGGTGLLPALLDAATKGFVLLAVACAVALAMRRAPASARHLAWLAALACALVLPLCSWLLPGWRVLPAWMRWQEPPRAVAAAISSPEPQQTAAPAYTIAEPAPRPSTEETMDTAALSRAVALPLTTSPAVVAPRPFHISAGVLFIIWISGAAVMLLPLAWSLGALFRTLRRSRVAGESLAAQVAAVADELGLKRRIHVLLGAPDAMPMVWGIFRAHLLLPANADAWPATRLRAVLLHELAHLHRRDPLALLIAQLALAVHWFNPLAWFAMHRLRAEQERACDDFVLRHGIRASEYATDLLAVATGLRAEPGAAAALAMAHPARIEGRIASVLDEARSRTSLTRRLILATALFAALVALPLAMLSAADEKAKDVVAASPADWGKASPEGLQVRLQTEKSGETPSLALSLRNSGKQPLSYFGVPVECQVEVDGQWYGWTQMVISNGYGNPLPPGAEKTWPANIDLTDTWARPAEGEMQKWSSFGIGLKWGAPLKLSPGRHTVRVFVHLENRNIAGAGKPFEAISNPIEIEIAAAIPPGTEKEEPWVEKVERAKRAEIEAKLPDEQKTEAGRKAILAENTRTSVDALAAKTASTLTGPPGLGSPDPVAVTAATLRVQKLIDYGKGSEAARREVATLAAAPIAKYARGEEKEWRSGHDDLLFVLSALKVHELLPTVVIAYELLQASYENRVPAKDPRENGWIPHDRGANQYFYLFWDASLPDFAMDAAAPDAAKKLAKEYATLREGDEETGYTSGATTVRAVNPQGRSKLVVRIWDFRAAMQAAGKWNAVELEPRATDSEAPFRAIIKWSTAAVGPKPASGESAMVPKIEVKGNTSDKAVPGATAPFASRTPGSLVAKADGLPLIGVFLVAEPGDQESITIPLYDPKAAEAVAVNPAPMLVTTDFAPPGVFVDPKIDKFVVLLGVVNTGARKKFSEASERNLGREMVWVVDGAVRFRTPVRYATPHAYQNCVDIWGNAAQAAEFQKKFAAALTSRPLSASLADRLSSTPAPTEPGGLASEWARVQPRTSAAQAAYKFLLARYNKGADGKLYGVLDGVHEAIVEKLGTSPKDAEALHALRRRIEIEEAWKPVEFAAFLDEVAALDPDLLNVVPPTPPASQAPLASPSLRADGLPLAGVYLVAKDGAADSFTIPLERTTTLNLPFRAGTGINLETVALERTPILTTADFTKLVVEPSSGRKFTVSVSLSDDALKRYSAACEQYLGREKVWVINGVGRTRYDSGYASPGGGYGVDITENTAQAAELQKKFNAALAALPAPKTLPILAAAEWDVKPKNAAVWPAYETFIATQLPSGWLDLSGLYHLHKNLVAEIGKAPANAAALHTLRRRLETESQWKPGDLAAFLDDVAAIDPGLANKGAAAEAFIRVKFGEKPTRPSPPTASPVPVATYKNTKEMDEKEGRRVREILLEHKIQWNATASAGVTVSVPAPQAVEARKLLAAAIKAEGLRLTIVELEENGKRVREVRAADGARAEASPETVAELTKKIGAVLPKGWKVAFDKEASWLAISRDERVMAVTNAPSMGANEKPELKKYQFELRVEPLVTSEEYRQRVVEKAHIGKQIEALSQKLRAMNVPVAKVSFSGRTEEEKALVANYDRLQETQPELPDFYFKDISLSKTWNYTMPANERQRLEFQQLEEKIEKLLTAYPEN